MFKKWLYLNESVSFTVEGYENSSINNIWELATYLTKKLIAIPEFNQGTNHEKLTIDGANTNTKDGTLNFYTKDIPPAKIPTILKGTIYYMDEIGVKHGQWRQDQSNLFRGEAVYRIDVKISANRQDIPPDINIANVTAEIILKDILNINNIHNIHEFSISARDLLIKLNSVSDFQIKANTEQPSIEKNVINSGVSEERIKRNINALIALCKWAIAHDYDTIQLV